jgi:Ribbon-helix-helix protein, copG family
MGHILAMLAAGATRLLLVARSARRMNRIPRLDHERMSRYHRWYHTFMTKTTLYLPDDLKEAVTRVARQRGVSEAEVIRESLRATVGRQRPKPRGGLFASGSPVARDADRHLAGFGER